MHRVRFYKLIWVLLHTVITTGKKGYIAIQGCSTLFIVLALMFENMINA